MSSSLVSPPNGRIPAWKRLGLKLKAASDDQTEPASAHQGTSSSSSANGTTSHSDGPAASSKRKSLGAPAQVHSAKKPRREEPKTPAPASTKVRTPKSVSFATELELSAPPTPTTSSLKAPKRPKQKQEKPATQTAKGTPPNTAAAKPLVKKQNAVANLQSAIEYLRQWHSARDAWKFNKNHQTRLLEYVFSDETTIPAVDINVFYEYIQPLKGFVRKRLRETAVEVKTKDMEQGAEGFSSSNSTEVLARKQKEYEDVIAGFLREARTPEKRRFEEMEYVLRTADMEMSRRVVKRMRAEMVIDELSGSEDSETSTTTTTTGTSAESGAENVSGEGSAEGGAPVTDGDKRVKLNDGTQRRIRRSKVRTAEVEDDTSSSSDDESDADDDTSSSGSDDSSDSSDSDNAMEVDQARNDAETSSSSSSSSSSEADSDSEDDSDDEA